MALSMWDAVNMNCLSAIRISDDELVKRKVQLGDSNFEYVEVLSGLKLGDRVVVSDMNSYKNKNKLKLK